MLEFKVCLQFLLEAHNADCHIKLYVYICVLAIRSDEQERFGTGQHRSSGGQFCCLPDGCIKDLSPAAHLPIVEAELHND